MVYENLDQGVRCLLHKVLSYGFIKKEHEHKHERSHLLDSILKSFNKSTGVSMLNISSLKAVLLIIPVIRTRYMIYTL